MMLMVRTVLTALMTMHNDSIDDDNNTKQTTHVVYVIVLSMMPTQ